MSDAQDPYCYEGTTVLKNLGNYDDQHPLDLFKSESLTLALVTLQETPLTLPFGPDRLKETHRHLFKDIYSWAGAFRENTGRMTKYRKNSYVTYADSHYLQREIEKVFMSLATENHLQNLDPSSFTKRMAHYYSELMPFIRFQRAIAARCGLS